MSMAEILALLLGSTKQTWFSH